MRIEYVINGGEDRIGGNISISFKGLDGEAILHRMDLKGIEIATGSACDSKNRQTSHVLKAIGLSDDYAHGTVRISFGIENTEDDAKIVARELTDIVEGMSGSR